MRVGRLLAPVIGVALIVCTLYAQRPFRQYPAWEYYNFPLPNDWNQPGEWVFARMMYPTTSIRLDWQSEYKRGMDWREGNTNWTIDYPRSDRHLAAAVRRLTRVNARSVEQPINLDDETDDLFNYPWLYAVEVGHWELTDHQIERFREYLLRGGFFMCDDFHGTNEWEVFQYTMQKVLPGKQIVDIPDTDPILHTVFDVDDRYQVPGMQFVQSGHVYEKDGYHAVWRGIYDDNNRLMVAICHNVDLGDSWENADDPRYPEKFSALGIRIGIDYLIYALTH